jgi:acyl carrier protein
MWDNDHFKEQNSGLLMAQKFSEMYGLPYIMTPSVDKITDISEFNRDYGLDSGRSLVMDLISKV